MVAGIAEVVVGSTPTPSISFCERTTALNKASFGQLSDKIQQQCHCHINNCISSNTLNGGLQQLQRTIF
jgi:hypothetical protein